MSGTLSALALAAGLAEHWTDAYRQPRTVAPETLRALLGAMDLPADSDADIRASHERLARARGDAQLPAMMVTTAGGMLRLPPPPARVITKSAQPTRSPWPDTPRPMPPACHNWKRQRFPATTR